MGPRGPKELGLFLAYHCCYRVSYAIPITLALGIFSVSTGDLFVCKERAPIEILAPDLKNGEKHQLSLPFLNKTLALLIRI